MAPAAKGLDSASGVVVERATAGQVAVEPRAVVAAVPTYGNPVVGEEAAAEQVVEVGPELVVAVEPAAEVEAVAEAGQGAVVEREVEPVVEVEPAAVAEPAAVEESEGEAGQAEEARDKGVAR
jgi:hypothetical protein